MENKIYVDKGAFDAHVYFTHNGFRMELSARQVRNGEFTAHYYDEISECVCAWPLNRKDDFELIYQIDRALRVTE